jgi:hypothetical protein
MRPRIQEFTDSLLDSVQGKVQFDLVGDFAAPLPATVLADLLGARAEDFPRFRSWSDSIAKLFAVGEFTDELIDELRHTFLAIGDYIHGLIEDRRRARRHDLISHLLDVQEQGAPLSDEDMQAECILLLAGGHETTASLIQTSMLALLQAPQQAQRLRDDPSLMPNAIDELMRYDGAVKWLTRMAREDIEIREAKIEAGDLVVLLMGAANRDPGQFSDPGRLDITRNEGRHVGFGYGIHFCEGAQLGRMEVEIALNTLLRRMPALRLAVPVETLAWDSGPPLRALKAMPVAF